MGARFPSTFASLPLAVTGSGGNVILCSTASIVQAFAGQAIALFYEAQYLDGASPINPNLQLVTGVLVTSPIIYATGALGIGTTAVIRRISGMFVHIPTAEICTPYSILFNNTNSGTSVNLTFNTLVAIGL